MGVEVTTGRDVLEATVRDIVELAQEVTIGLHQDAEPYPDGTDVVEVGRAQEFGSGNIPPRPFERGWFDSGGARELYETGREAIGETIDGTAEPEQVGEAIGTTGRDGVRAYIETGTNLQALAQATRDNPDRDQRGIPLLDTGHLVDQIDYRVEAD